MSCFSVTARSSVAIIGRTAAIVALILISAWAASPAHAQQTGSSPAAQSRSKAQSVRTPTTTNLVTSTLKDDRSRKADPTSTQGGAPPSEYRK